MAQSAGLSVSETKQEMIVEAAIVTANWRKNSPEIPAMKAAGTNTAQSVRAMAMSAPPDLVHSPPGGFRRRITDAQVAFDIPDDADDWGDTATAARGQCHTRTCG